MKTTPCGKKSEHKFCDDTNCKICSKESSKAIQKSIIEKGLKMRGLFIPTKSGVIEITNNVNIDSLDII